MFRIQFNLKNDKASSISITAKVKAKRTHHVSCIHEHGTCKQQSDELERYPQPTKEEVQCSISTWVSHGQNSNHVTSKRLMLTSHVTGHVRPWPLKQIILIHQICICSWSNQFYLITLRRITCVVWHHISLFHLPRHKTKTGTMITVFPALGYNEHVELSLHFPLWLAIIYVSICLSMYCMYLLNTLLYCR